MYTVDVRSIEGGIKVEARLEKATGEVLKKVEKRVLHDSTYFR